MYVEERLDKILYILKTRQVESVSNLTRELFISETSIRRDLRKLEELGEY
jgi:DeoR/GlpR family transcriptional regulator of sugar metabolism